MSVADAFDFTPLSIPFVLLFLGLLALFVAQMLVQGDLIVRSAIKAVSLIALPWAAGVALTMNLDAPLLVERIVRLYTGMLALLSPAVLFMSLALGAQIEHQRSLFHIFSLLGVMACIVSWTTELVVGGVWETPWGFWYPRAGPLYLASFGLVSIATAVGIYLSRQVLLDQRPEPERVRLLVFVTGAWVISGADVLLGYGIGFYPLSVLPALAGVFLLFRGSLRAHARTHGARWRIDWGAAVELAVLAVIVPLIGVAAWAASPQPGGLGGGLFIALLLLVPLFGTAQAVAFMIRSYVETAPDSTMSSDVEEALERFAENSRECRDEASLVEALSELLDQYSELSSLRLYVPGSGRRWHQVTTGSIESSISMPTDVQEWLLEHRWLVQAHDLDSRRIGKLRAPLERIFTVTRADLLIPLVERGVLVGVATAGLSEGVHALATQSLQLLREASRVAARTLTYIGMFREAKERIEIAKELEVASAARHARSPGEERYAYAACEVIGHYQPAAQFGGDWWTSHELDDGRVLVVVGDVTGHGIPAALVSSTVASACETARRMLGEHIDVRSVLELLNDAVLGIGAQQYTMSCFAAIFDPRAGEVAFANAGYPFPCVCRQAQQSGGETELHALVSRGTRLGTPEPVVSVASFALEANDVIVIYSDSLIEATNAASERYGERRLQRVLRNYVRGAGKRACEVIIDDARSHYGDHPVPDDVTVIVVRLGAGDGTDGAAAVL